MAKSTLERRQSRSSAPGCLKLTPWSALFSTVLFMAGLSLWIAGAVKVNGYTQQVAEGIEVNSRVLDTLKSAVLTAILAMAVSGVALTALVVGLSLVRTAQRSMLAGSCCCSSWDTPEPYLFTAYRFFGGMMNVMVWLLLLAVVAMLMIMLLWLGGALAINSAITKGRTQADNVLAPLGLDLNSASDASAATMAILTPLLSSSSNVSQIASLLNSPEAAQLAFQPICPPFCLNLGSFAMFLQSSSCVCGSDKLNSIQQAAQEGRKVVLIGLAGAFAMYVASTLLLMILSGHYVVARFDRSTARQRKQQAAEEYGAGYLADPADCKMEFPVPEPAPYGAAAGEYDMDGCAGAGYGGKFVQYATPSSAIAGDSSGAGFASSYPYGTVARV